MPAPVTKTFYFNTASFSETTYGGLLENSPPDTNTTWGWIVGTNNPPLYCEMNRGIEVARNSAQWQATPTQSIPNQAAGGSAGGNGWIAGPYNGEFVGGTWEITQSVKATSNATGQDGRFIYRVWTCQSGSGAGANLVTSNFISSSAVINLTTTAVQLTSSVILPQIILHNEYIFFQTYWNIIGAATNVNADINNVFGVLSGSVKPTSFVADRVFVINQTNNSLV